MCRYGGGTHLKGRVSAVIARMYVNPHHNLLWIIYTVSTKSVVVWLCGDEGQVKNVPYVNLNEARQEQRVRHVTELHCK